MDKVKILDKQALEASLAKNWMSFIESNKLLAFILTKVRDTKFKRVTENLPSVKKQIQISVSKIEIVKDENHGSALQALVDFTVPVSNNDIAIGTSEITFSFSGKIIEERTLGNLYLIK